jgi:hypothetical protein
MTMLQAASGPRTIWRSACSSHSRRTAFLFSLSHKTGEFVSQHNLSIEEVERTLELWKLQGPHGG